MLKNTTEWEDERDNLKFESLQMIVSEDNETGWD